MTKNLSAVVIGSRTGRHLKTPVSVLPFGETTILNRTLSAYLEAGFTELILVLSYRAAEVQASLGDLAGKVQLVTAADPDEEFGSLMRSGCERVSSSARGFALGMGDQPLLQPAFLTALGEKFVSSKSKILVPVCQGHLGFPVFFDISLASEFKKLPPQAELWDLLKARGQDVFDCGVYETAVVRHVDDMEDYHAMLRLAGLPIPETPPEIEPGNGATPESAMAPEAGFLGPVRRVEAVEE